MPPWHNAIYGIIEPWLGKSKESTSSPSGFSRLSDDEQVEVGRVVELLVEHGPALPFPYSSGIAGSRHRQMRELRIQHRGRPYRVLYAFDPRRTAILLLGGDQTGNPRWYEENVPKADDRYDDYLREIEKERLI